jgi:tetratricopeptide (TPR) repeat protein
MRIECSNAHAMSGSSSSAGLAGALFLLLLLPGVAVRAAQTLVEDPRIRPLENSLRVATEQHASPEELGNLWRALAFQYQNGFEIEKAEDAYVHAIRLLRGTPLKAQYAGSLHGLAEIYVMESRLKEARRDLAPALAIFEELGDTRSAASVRETLAADFLRDHKFREAEIEASKAIAALESLDHPELSRLENAYATRARAVAEEGRPDLALKDATHAHSLAIKNSAANSIDSIVTLLVQGEVQMQAGLETEGEQSMTEALKLVRSRTDLPPAMSSSLQASMLERAAISLRKAHRNQEAKVLEEQVRQAKSAASAGCSGCTVSVSSLMPQ